MYIYLIKYNGEVIAAASDDDSATAVISQYKDYNEGMNPELFEKEAVRYFKGDKNEV